MSRSRDIPHTHLPPPVSEAYLCRMVGAQLARRGFDGAEAGALAEMERLVERHIQRLFITAQEYARHSGRGTPFARDLLVAQEASGWEIAGLKREAKRKRGFPIELVTELEPVERPPHPGIASVPPPSDGDEADVKPKITTEVPAYAWDGAPPLPEPWTYRPGQPEPPPQPQGRVSAGVLEFIKLTATERGDIPPELGLVDYRRGDGRESKRRWGVKGVGA